MEKIKKLVKEKLCKKGEAYRKRRMAAGEKSSAYLSGRAVKVCKGQMSGKKKKTNEAEFNKGEKEKVKDMIKSLKKSSKGHAGQAKYLTKLVKEDEESNNRVPGAALILPRGKEVILQAEEEDYKRGLLVTLEESGGYKIKYWYGDDVKVYPAEVEVDGKSIKKDAIEVDILFHPELEENVAPNHNGKSAPYGSGYKELNVDKMAESLRDWFKKEDWVRINTSGNISGDCGTMKKGKATTRCLPKKKAQSLTKAERKATVAKKVRGSKKGKQFVSVKENFEMGDRVKLTPDYEETPGEVFTITQTSGNRYFIADEDGRGWYTYGDQLVIADDELDEDRKAKEYIKSIEDEDEREEERKRMFDNDEYINEAKKKKKKEKKDPPIGKPKRGGSKAYYVYVRDPKTKKVKKVSFGSGGLRAKIRNPKARKAFAARHNCKNKKDRTKAGYWSCNLPKYAPQLGLGAKMNTFW